MKLLACIKKDIKLICGNGVKSVLLLLLPVLLLFLLIFYMRGMASESTYLKPFSIAVRDEDDTVMSHILITQLRNISLFDSVITDKTIEQDDLFESNCAAIITIPKDFFYDLYDMQDTDVRLILNEKMPREALSVRTAVGSIVGILEQNQRVYFSDAKIRYGEIDPSVQREIFEKYSSASIEDALNRLQYFEIESLYRDEARAETVYFCIGVVSMLLLFIPLCIVRNLHEEKELGIIDRIAASNGGSFQIVLSKLITSVILTAFPVAAVLLLSGMPNVLSLLPALVILFLVSFLFFFFLSLLCKSPEKTQLIGNIILILMLVTGGALFPYRLFPSPIRILSRCTIPYYVMRAFYAASVDRGVFEVLRTILPALYVIPVLSLLSYVLYKKPFLRKGVKK